MESGEVVIPVALDWLDRRGREDNWYLHVNIWDPHAPYRAPKEIGNPFENEPPPSWMTEEIRKKTWDNYGPGSAQEPCGAYTNPENYQKWERMAWQIDSMDAYKKFIDGYDCGVFHADMMAGQLFAKLEELGVYDDTLIIVSSDHGENMGELSVYGDHQTGDHITNRVPLLVRHPQGLGGRGRVDHALHYQFDYAATILEMVGQKVPESWDGKSFFSAFKAEQDKGRDYLVVSNCAWSCQRSVRWSDYILIRSYHTGFKNYPELMLFNVREDPHELHNLAESRPDLVNEGLAKLESWTTSEMMLSTRTEDPLWIVMREGGPHHARFTSPGFEQYKERLIRTGRENHAKALDDRSKQFAYCKVQ